MECPEDGGVETLQVVATRTPKRQLHWFFVEMLQLCQLRVMAISEWIAMVGSIRCEEM
uniref:Uncharacterized protein n=1 Tax=Fagus sylvatica TaxID=28930 RepID=A0A2N9HYY5_FAGSY